VVVTRVAGVIVMCLVLTFFVLNLTFIVLGVLVALIGGVLALWPVHQAWLERLVAATRRSLILPFPLAFVVIITTTAVIAILPLVVVAIVLVASPAVAILTSVTLFCHTADLLMEPLAQFVIYLASHVLLDLHQK
jgi:hypothetical protein